MNEQELQEVKNKAEQGDAEAQFLLAKHYDAQSPDCREAIRWYRAAAEQGHAKAQNNLGMCIIKKDNNYSEAFEWFSKAAEKGSAAAQYNLGRCYLFGRGASGFATAMKWFHISAGQDYPKARRMLKDLAEEEKLFLAAEQGDPNAQYKLADACRKGFINNKSEAFKWFYKAAEGGHTDGQFETASCFVSGNGVKKDRAEALKWIEKAANQGHPKAQKIILGKAEFDLMYKAAEYGDARSQFKIGTFYETGFGVNKDCEKAFDWIRKAAEQGFAEAQFKLGTFYERGIGVNKDKNEAFEWIEKAAGQDNAEAQFRLGTFYENGFGVEKDSKKAFEWIEKAAGQDNAEAQFKLGTLYEHGIGVKKNGEKAIDWFHKAAFHGDQALASEAFFKIGKCHFEGKIVKQDYARAVECFLWAVSGFRAAGNFSSTDTPMDMLALCYQNGYGVKPDHERAKNWNYWANRSRGFFID